MPATPATETDRIGEWVAQLQWSDVPPACLHALHASLQYNLALGMAGCAPADPAQRALRAVFRSGGRAAVWATGEMRTATDAAALNAAAVACTGQNDTLACINGHLGCIVWPTVLALAQETGAVAKDIWAAAAAGYEAPARIAGSGAGAATRRGFRGTSVFGVFAAAAAAARLLGLGPRCAADALSLAAQAAGGLMQCYAEGSDEPSLQVAHAGRSGMTAALLARQGLRCARQVLEGPFGFWQAFAGEVPAPQSPAWQLPQLRFKPFAGCAINQSGALALLGVRERLCGEVTRVVLGLDPAQAAHPGVAAYGPFASAQAAIMSAPFMLQLLLETGRVTHADFAAQRRMGPLHERSRRVVVVADPSVAPFGCRLRIETARGSAMEAVGVAEPGVAACTPEYAQIAGRLLPPAAARQLRALVAQCAAPRSPRAFDALFSFANSNPWTSTTT